MVIVTGGTGHIGNVLVRELVSLKEHVRVVVAPFDDVSSIDGLGVETVTADIRDVDSLVKAFEGGNCVYHLAGIISIGSGKRKIIHAINVNGTKNVIDACFKAGIQRLVYASSIHAFIEPPFGTPIIETKNFDPLKVVGNYAKTKAEATKEVLKAVDRGLDAVIVHPTGVIGPYEFKLSNTGQLILDFIKKRLYIYIDGSYDFVDVRDVAKGLILACKKGRKGENYILSGEQITVKGILDILQEETGIASPKLKIPAWIAKLTGPLSELYYMIRKQQPLYTSYSVSTLLSNSLTTHEKAFRELGYTARPIKESIIDTAKWLKEYRNLPDLQS